jgi:hypothetical protein
MITNFIYLLMYLYIWFNWTIFSIPFLLLIVGNHIYMYNKIFIDSIPEFKFDRDLYVEFLDDIGPI